MSNETIPPYPCLLFTFHYRARETAAAIPSHGSRMRSEYVQHQDWAITSSHNPSANTTLEHPGGEARNYAPAARPHQQAETLTAAFLLRRHEHPLNHPIPIRELTADCVPPIPYKQAGDINDILN